MQYGLLVFELKNRRVKIQSIKKQKKTGIYPKIRFQIFNSKKSNLTENWA